MVETHKRKRKNTVITKITLTISNAEHIKHTLSTNKPYRHQQHLPKNSQNVSGDVRMAIRYGRNTFALFDNCYVKAFKHLVREGCK